MPDTAKQWLPRILIGGAVGVMCYIALATLGGNWNLWGPTTIKRLYFSMTAISPRWLGTVLDYLLWFAFGAELGVATLPFDDRGKVLALKSLAHFALMMLTVSIWACLEFSNYPLSFFIPRFLPDYLLPVAGVYALIWVVRWFRWYFELASIKEKLGLNKEKKL